MTYNLVETWTITSYERGGLGTGVAERKEMTFAPLTTMMLKQVLPQYPLHIAFYCLSTVPPNSSPERRAKQASAAAGNLAPRAE